MVLVRNRTIPTDSTIKSTKHKILELFHQNTQGLENKRNKLISSLYSAILHTEHQMKRLELEHTHTENYRSGVKCCRQSMEGGGVSIFVKKP
jgi:hypothetical protein